MQPSTPNDGSTETAEPIEPAEQTGPSEERTGFGIPPALRYPAYRAYWFGLLASVSGFQMFRVGQGWLIYEITGSPWSLGLVGRPTPSRPSSSTYLAASLPTDWTNVG